MLYFLLHRLSHYAEEKGKSSRGKKKNPAPRPSRVLGVSPLRCDGRGDAPNNSGAGHRCCPLLLQMPVADLARPARSSECYFPSRDVVLPSPSTRAWNGFHLLPAAARAGVHPPRRSFLLANSRLFSGWRESNEKSLPGQGNRKPCKHSEEPNGVQSVPRAVPRAGAMRAEGRERESHVSLRQPCCAADPYVPTPASITGREGGRGSAQRWVGGKEEDWCQARRPCQGQELPSPCHCRTHDPTLDQAGNRGLFSLSFAPGGLCPLRAGTSQATRGATQLPQGGASTCHWTGKRRADFFSPLPEKSDV